MSVLETSILAITEVPQFFQVMSVAVAVILVSKFFRA